MASVINTLNPGGEAASALRSMWDAEFKLTAMEEGVIHPDIPRSSAEKIGDAMYVRIVPFLTAQTLSSTGDADLGGLTADTGAITRVSTTPNRRYVAVGFPIHTTAALLGSDNANLRSAYRQQMRTTLDGAMDATAGALAGSLSVIKGPGNFDKATLLDMDQTLRTNGANHVKNGTVTYLKYSPTQSKYLKAISEIMNADARGGADNPNVSGVLVKAWGIALAETGNIYFSGGNYWNMLFVGSAFAKGFNYEPGLLPEQTNGLADFFIGYAEYGFVECFDSDAVVLKSA